MRNNLLRAAVASALACTAFDAAPYDEAGHFFTAYALVTTAQPADTPPVRMLMSLCAQLPDMAEDLDATAVYARLIKRSPAAWARWGRYDDTASDDVRKMVTVQQLLHGLTGGSAKAVNEVAARLVASLRSTVAAPPRGVSPAAASCALGFALHFYGDATAHRRMDQPIGDGMSMYGTGLGHAVHLHYPDYPLCDMLASGLRIFSHCQFTHGDRQRFGLWKAIWQNAGPIYDPADFREQDPQVRVVRLASVAQLGDSASDRNHWNEDGMRATLAPARPTDTRIDGYVKFIDGQNSNQPCEKVLGEALRSIDELKRVDAAGLTCAAVWKTYYKAVLQAFAAVDPKVRAPLDRPYDQIYLEMPLDE